MLGYVVANERGSTDPLIAMIVTELLAQGRSVIGAIQENTPMPNSTRCNMDLRILGQSERVRISQDLGEMATGCRLDPQELEHAVGLVEGTLTDTTDLLVVNKFGKAEAEGRGFRHLIGKALSQGIPVLTAVNAANLASFVDFAGEIAEELPAQADDLRAWLENTLSEIAEA